jgi:trigger factor
VKSSTETLSPTRIKLTIEVPFEEFEPSLAEAYKTIGAQVTCCRSGTARRCRSRRSSP